LSFIEIEIVILGLAFCFFEEEFVYYFDILKYFYYFSRSVFDYFSPIFYLFSRREGLGKNLFCLIEDDFLRLEGECSGGYSNNCLEV